MFKIRYQPDTQQSNIEMLNQYKKYNHISLPLYKKALSIINKGYRVQYVIQDNGHLKVLKVNKSTKL